MIVGVIGSGALGPDLAYGFAVALGKLPAGRIYLHDRCEHALETGMARLRRYGEQGRARGKLSAQAAQALLERVTPTLDLAELAACDYVIEAASEELALKRALLAKLEQVVRPDCLIGFATSGLPRASLVGQAARPARCFVTHPFFPAWRSLPIEVVASEDAELTARLLRVLKRLGKVPILTADVPCFAADDIFCNYCAEAARIVEEGLATPAELDQLANEALGGGGPFQVIDRTHGNLLNVHCLTLLEEVTGSSWFAPPPSFARLGAQPWLEPTQAGVARLAPEPSQARLAPERGQALLERLLAVLFGRAYAVVEHGTCDPANLDWLTQQALGFRRGLLALAEELGAERVRAICTRYAAEHPGYPLPQCLATAQLPRFYHYVRLERRDELAVVTIQRPEVRNALSEQTLDELATVLDELAAQERVRGIVLTSYEGALAGADIQELARIESPAAAQAMCARGQAVINRLAALGKPIVAALDGPVLGGGCELAMGCHARIVGPRLTLGQPEVNLGVIPGYGGTQRLPRLLGFERGLELLRTGRVIGAEEACAWGWAHGAPAADPLAAALALLHQHLAGEVELRLLDPAPLSVPATLAPLEIGHRSRAIDEILLQVVREGLARPLAAGLAIEAAGVARCHQTVDYALGMANFLANGPRVPALFLHE